MKAPKIIIDIDDLRQAKKRSFFGSTALGNAKGPCQGKILLLGIQALRIYCKSKKCLYIEPT